MEWISVKDRLPEDRKTVLYYSVLGAWFLGHYKSDTKEWYDLSIQKPIDKHFNITHWMFLPNPPKNREG